MSRCDICLCGNEKDACLDVLVPAEKAFFNPMMDSKAARALSLSNKKKRPQRALFCLAERGIVRSIHGPHPYVLRTPGPAFGGPDSLLRIGRTLRGFSSIALPETKRRPKKGVFSFLAEREGFEPSIRLLTLYSLSRGAPSASRASLQKLFPWRHGAGKDTGRSLSGKEAISAHPTHRSCRPRLRSRP
jgi:hypothetical protein